MPLARNKKTVEYIAMKLLKRQSTSTATSNCRRSSLPPDGAAAAASAGTLTSGIRAIELDQIEEGEARGTRQGPSETGG